MKKAYGIEHVDAADLVDQPGGVQQPLGRTGVDMDAVCIGAPRWVTAGSRAVQQSRTGTGDGLTLNKSPP
ncbi:hypothetical protein [Streptomyces sp. NPDC046197]|uniref:hypothetical protein n=1 Tax=Streptomyces sp. NPDC046197 TaxID=3154337 RepID=UPI003406D8EF